MPTSPDPYGFLVDVVAAVVVAALVAVLVDFLLDPHAARTNAPKLAAPAPPTVLKNFLRSRSSRTSRSTTPTGCPADSELAGSSLAVVGMPLPPVDGCVP